MEGISEDTTLKVLTAREARAVFAVAETMFPPNDTLKTTVHDAEVLRYVDDLLASLPFKERCLIRCLFALFEVQMVVTHPRGATRFSKASLEARTRSLSQWEKSSLHMQRVAFQALRSLILWAYVDHPVVAKEFGVEPGSAVIARRNIRAAVAANAASNAAK